MDRLLSKLLAAARTRPPSDRVPYAFEQRILARLKEQSRLDEWAVWARALWRGAALCLMITLLLSAWSLLTSTGTAPTTDLSQELDNTVLAAVDQEQGTDFLC